MAIAELGANAAKAREQARYQDDTVQEPEVIDALTAFVVYSMPDGSIRFTPDLHKPILVQREPHLDEVSGMLHAVAEQLVVNKASMAAMQLTVPNVLNNMPAVFQQMASNAQAEAVASTVLAR